MMEVTKVLTSVFMLCLSGPTFGYPFTHSNLFSATGGTGPRGQQDQQQLPAHLEDYLANRGSQQQQPQQQLPTHLEDYLANYVQVAQQYKPQYQPAYQQQQGYIAQVPQQKLNAETLAALLPYLSSSSSSLNGGSAAMASPDYAYPEYPAAAAAPAYTDDDGTWYDDMAQQQYNNEPTQQDEEQVVLQLLLDHLNGRYSLDDLAALEREAEIEENTESQLQSLMNKKVRRHEIMNDFSNGDEQHLTIRRLREQVGDNTSEQEKDGDNIEEKEQDSHARDNTNADSQESASEIGPSQDHKSSANTSTGLQKRSWGHPWGRSRGQTVGHLSFWGPNRYQSHRARKGDIGHINFFSHR